MSLTISIDSKDDIKERAADSRGRITLGSEYAGKDVTVAVIEK